MDAAQFHQIADRLGAGKVEQTYELACARYDLRERPETAARARPVRHLEEVKFARSAWTPSGTEWPAGWDEPPKDWAMEWWERHRAVQEAAGRF